MRKPCGWTHSRISRTKLRFFQTSPSLSFLSPLYISSSAMLFSYFEGIVFNELVFSSFIQPASALETFECNCCIGFRPVGRESTHLEFFGNGTFSSSMIPTISRSTFVIGSLFVPQPPDLLEGHT